MTRLLLSQYITIPKLSKTYNLSPQRLRAKVEALKLPVYRMGRTVLIRLSDVPRLMEKRRPWGRRNKN